MDMASRIKERRLAMGYTQEALATKLGLQKSAIAKYENGRVENIKRSVIAKMSEVLDCSPAYLMGWDDSPALPPYDNIRPLQTQILPVLGHIAAGEPILMEEEREVYVETQIKADFILVVDGDSMIGARIYNGDIVFVRQQPTVENGEIAVVAVGDSATLKRFYKYDNMIILRPENPDFREQVYQGSELENIRVLGKAVAFQSDIK